MHRVKLLLVLGDGASRAPTIPHGLWTLRCTGHVIARLSANSWDGVALRHTCFAKACVHLLRLVSLRCLSCDIVGEMLLSTRQSGMWPRVAGGVAFPTQTRTAMRAAVVASISSGTGFLSSLRCNDRSWHDGSHTVPIYASYTILTPSCRRCNWSSAGSCFRWLELHRL